ncbi:unnamed protein product [Urochloa humidicola]
MLSFRRESVVFIPVDGALVPTYVFVAEQICYLFVPTDSWFLLAPCITFFVCVGDRICFVYILFTYSISSSSGTHFFIYFPRSMVFLFIELFLLRMMQLRCVHGILTRSA